RGARHLTVRLSFPTRRSSDLVAAGDHQSVGARFAHRRGLVRAGEAVGSAPREAAVAAALEHHAGDVAGEGSACGLCAWEVIVHVHRSGAGPDASHAAGAYDGV